MDFVYPAQLKELYDKSSRKEKIFQELQEFTVHGWASLVEYRDSNTGAHLHRIVKYTSLLSEELRKLNKYSDYITDAYISDLKLAAMLHDIGKVGVSDDILYKPGRLSSSEFNEIKRHVEIGGSFIKKIKDNWGEKYSGIRNYLDIGHQVALYHHERWDGSGYIHGLKGESIPLSARIVALADVYDALTSERPYKNAWSHRIAADEIYGEKGTHFDPEIVEAFQRVENEFIVVSSAA